MNGGCDRSCLGLTAIRQSGRSFNAADSTEKRTSGLGVTTIPKPFRAAPRGLSAGIRSRFAAWQSQAAFYFRRNWWGAKGIEPLRAPSATAVQLVLPAATASIAAYAPRKNNPYSATLGRYNPAVSGVGRLPSRFGKPHRAGCCRLRQANIILFPLLSLRVE